MRPAPALRVVSLAAALVLLSVFGAHHARAAEATICGAIDEGRVTGLQPGAPHVLLVIAESYGRSDAELVRCARSNDGYRLEWSRRGGVGWAGIAPYGAKREGDGRSPSGVFALDRPFGVADPGSSIGYLQLTPTSCWDSTVGSPRYNTYRDDASCGADDEHMWDWSGYQYAEGMVIGYNTAPVVPGAGSAIFLHVGGPGTGGCVASDRATVEELIRTASAGDLIVIGVRSELVAAPTVRSEPPGPPLAVADPAPPSTATIANAPVEVAPTTTTAPIVASIAIASATSDGPEAVTTVSALQHDGSDPTSALTRSVLVLLLMFGALALAIVVPVGVARRRRNLVPR